MTETDMKREAVAKALYVASGGDEAVFPWPCRGSERYRRLADAAIDAYLAGPLATYVAAGWVSENAAKPLTGT